MGDELKDLLLQGEDPKAVIRELQEENEKLRAQVRLQEPSDRAPTVVKYKTPKRKKGAYYAVAAQMFSDWHCGEGVTLAETNGLNEYNPDICKRRVERVFDYALWRVNIERSEATIETNVMWLLGDLISGMIHVDLQRTNTLDVVGELEFLRPLLYSCVDFMLDNGDFRKIYIPCIWGNHSRMNPRKELVKAGRGDSLEAIVYGDLERRYEGEERIEVDIAGGPLLYHTLDGFRQRGFHGNHQISYNKGLGGVVVPLNRALPRMDEGIRAHFNVCGHWHRREYSPKALINSSVVGYSALGAAWGFAPEPAQQWFYTFDPKSLQVLGVWALFGESPDDWLRRQREVLG